MSPGAACLFCAIAAGAEPAHIVYEDESTVAFLDVRPVFHGHVLVVSREHHETLTDIPPALLTPVMATVQMVAAGVEAALDAHGTFVAMNNRVSQSVPHLHVHVVPRRRKDGLRGFFWPRQPYDGPEQMQAVAERIRGALAAPDAVSAQPLH